MRQQYFYLKARLYHYVFLCSFWTQVYMTSVSRSLFSDMLLSLARLQVVMICDCWSKRIGRSAQNWSNLCSKDLILGASTTYSGRLFHVSATRNLIWDCLILVLHLYSPPLYIFYCHNVLLSERRPDRLHTFRMWVDHSLK